MEKAVMMQRVHCGVPPLSPSNEAQACVLLEGLITAELGNGVTSLMEDLETGRALGDFAEYACRPNRRRIKLALELRMMQKKLVYEHISAFTFLRLGAEKWEGRAIIDLFTEGSLAEGSTAVDGNAAQQKSEAFQNCVRWKAGYTKILGQMKTEPR